MALFEDVVAGISSSWTSTLAVGAGLVLVTPLVAPVLGAGLRVLTKTVIKGGMLAYTMGTAAIAAVGEQMRDLIAEVQDELDGRPARARTPEPPRTGGSTLVLDAQGQPLEAAP